jgi:non-specific serine/threonine protein kinase
MMTPHGRLVLVDDGEGAPIAAELTARLHAAFADGSGAGLLALAGREAAVLPPAWAYWRELTTRHIAAVCARPPADAGPGAGAAADDDDDARDTPGAAAPVPPPPADDLAAIAAAAPAMTGVEYVTADALAALWRELDGAFAAARAAHGSVADLLYALDPQWHLVGRVYFNLAENRRDDEAPFAFLATYTTWLPAQGRTRHVALGKALVEYAGAANRERLLSLLVPVRRASERCAWLRELVDDGAIYHPLRWTPAEALRMLTDVTTLEQAGVMVRMPATWRAGRPARPQVTATVGTPGMRMSAMTISADRRVPAGGATPRSTTSCASSIPFAASSTRQPRRASARPTSRRSSPSSSARMTTGGSRGGASCPVGRFAPSRSRPLTTRPPAPRRAARRRRRR